MSSLADAPRNVALSPSERANGSYSPASIQTALEGLHQDGLLILKNVVDVEHIDKLRSAMNSETQDILNNSKRAGLYNQGVASNILQCAPLAREDCHFDDVFFNRYVIQIANAYLGSKPIWNFTTGNNALAGTDAMRQPVHKDITFHHPTAPFYFIANFVLDDFTEANGATEFWLGSHSHTTSADQTPCTNETKVRDQKLGDPSCSVKSEVVEARRKVRPPIQAQCRKGDVMIRDLRTWHAGMPNVSSKDRIMVAIGYQAHWYQNNTQKLYLPLRYADYFMRAAGQPVEVRAEFVEDEEKDKLWKNYDFTFEPSVAVDRKVMAKL